MTTPPSTIMIDLTDVLEAGSVERAIEARCAGAMTHGALYHADPTTGRVAWSPTWTDDDYAGQPIVWTDDSMVRVECPSLQDAIQHPRAVAEMARAVCLYHGPRSDRRAWASLIRQMQAVGEAFAHIDADELHTP